MPPTSEWIAEDRDEVSRSGRGPWKGMKMGSCQSGMVYSAPLTATVLVLSM